MKKDFIYATMSAIAFVGAVSLTSCSSNEDVADINPTFDGEAVKTQFSISFPENVAKTRQTAGTVQNSEVLEDFRGMDNIVLYPFAAAGTEGQDPITGTSTKLGDAIQLTKMILPSEVTLSSEGYNTIPKASTPANSLTGGSNSVVFDDVSIPVGTGSFLFYGKAKDSEGGNVVNGALTMSGNEPSSIKFTPLQIYSETTLPEGSAGTALATYLSQIAQATHWADCAVSTNSNQTWYNAGLGELYTKFITLKAGSSLTVQAAVQDLFTTIKNNTDEVSVAIKNAILSSPSTIYSVSYATDTNSDGTLEFQGNIGNSETTYFPGVIGLPDGAALLEYNSNDKTFTQKLNGNGNTGANLTAKYADYVYPASLYYYCNSGVKTATTSQRSLYNGTNTWTQITGNEAFTGTAVGPSTRSVAILDQIQYAVGRLDAKIKCAATTLYDKNGEEYNASAGFTLTGILIGGQKEVGYNFVQSTSTSSTPYTIYDNVTKSTGVISFTTTDSEPNYTLALETAEGTKVYVAVELLNKGEDFQGADGVVPKGCKFYLVGELNPETGSKPTTASSLNQVFKQDYYTKANFTIQEGLPKTDTSFPSDGNSTGLGKAYNTIPDLRTPEMELGLSVDLKWEEGITFNVTF